MTIQISDSIIEETVKGIMENFPEASDGCTLQCVKWKYDALQFEFLDTETGIKYMLDKARLLSQFPLLFTNKWPKGCARAITSNDAEEWNDWLCQCDATDFDAFAQLACFGEVIYG